MTESVKRLANDSDLIEMMKDEPEQGLQLAISYYGKAVYKIVSMVMPASSPEDREEIVQDVFVRLWKSRDILDESKGIKSYIYAIARNTAIDRIRRSAKDSVMFIDQELLVALPDDAAGIEGPANELFQREVDDAIISCIEALEDPKDKVCYYRYYLNMRVKEIADVLDLDPKKIENILSRTKPILQEKLLAKGLR